MTSRRGERRPHGGVATRFLAPAVVLVMAIVAVLAVAGVFSSGHGRSASTRELPPSAITQPTVAQTPTTTAATPPVKHHRRHRRHHRRSTSTTTTPSPAVTAPTAPSPSATAQPTPSRATSSLTVQEGRSGAVAPPPATRTSGAGGFKPT